MCSLKLFVFLFVFCRPYTFEMVLLIRGRISFGGFLFLPDPFWVLTLLFTEFVVSPTHDYTTFSSYGSDVYTWLQSIFNLIKFFSSFLFHGFGDKAMLSSVSVFFTSFYASFSYVPLFLTFDYFLLVVKNNIKWMNIFAILNRLKG